MTDWKQWQGRVVGDNLPLTEYLAGTTESGVFLSVTDSQKLAVKLVSAGASANARLDHWKMAQGLSQSHLLKIHQSGRTTLDGVELLYLVMEYADENLSQVLTQRALTNDEAREMLPPLLETLEFLHSKGFVHGGVKPGNIMAVGEQLKLASDDMMRAGDIVNAPGAYDAPESKQGVSPASDVWSLGLTLLEVLTQEKPVSVVLVQNRAEALAEPFRGIVQNCVQVNPSLRWKVAEVREYLAGRPKEAPAKPKPVVREAAPRKANSLIGFGVPAVGIGLVVIAFAISFLFPHHSKPEPSAPASTSITTNAATEETVAPAAEPKPTTTERKSEAKPTRVLAEPRPAVRTAALAEDGVIHKVLPDVPRRALNTISGKVRVKVRVRVDREGRVVDSDFTSAGPSRYFASLAMDAAKQWKFTPSHSEGRAWNLLFEFRRSGAEAVESRVER